MLHLAQVQKKGYFGRAGLRLLAAQRSDHLWALVPESDILFTSEASAYNDEVLVLVDISSNHQVLDIREAKDWVLELVQNYLTLGITPTFLQQEMERSEQWRQSLTLQNQELDRRSLELEARREQIQALEEDLKRERKHLESLNPNLLKP